MVGTNQHPLLLFFLTEKKKISKINSVWIF
jgi:hypothetical protein